jgi:methylmalonyl-CoA/ethylmalonyl-CoA epimerase
MFFTFVMLVSITRGVIMISRVDHVAIAVKDYDKALSFFTEVLGAIPGSSGKDPGLKYYWENFCLGDLSRLELITPTASGSFLDNFLKDKPGGVHHVTLQTASIQMAKEALEKNNIPYFGFNDYGSVWKELFIHPKYAFGVLIQIAEFKADDWLAPSIRMPDNTRWKLDKEQEGITLKFAHPGGGTVKISLDRDEASHLLNELKQALD